MRKCPRDVGLILVLMAVLAGLAAAQSGQASPEEDMTSQEETSQEETSQEETTQEETTQEETTQEETTSVLPEGYSCVVCHSRAGELWSEETPVVEEQDVVTDLHWQKGLLCHDCHGGSPEIAQFKNHRDDPDFRSVRSRGAIPAFCGHCHSDMSYMRQYNPSARTDQEAEYWTSGHGLRLKASMEAAEAADTDAPQGADGNEAVEEGSGETEDTPPGDDAAGTVQQGGEGEVPLDLAVATCVDCHSHHNIRAINDTNSPVFPTHVGETCARCHSDEKLMAGRSYNDRPLRHDQYELWRNSVHGIALLEKGDLSAPTCNDCHGNHGALPPGVDSVANACGTCHGKVAKLFAGAQMKHKFEEVGLPGCATCHGNHETREPTDDMLGMGDQSICQKCHNQDNPQLGATLAGAETARAMRTQLEELKQEIGAAEAKIQEAERLGVMVQGPRFDLREAFDALTESRTQVHSFQLEPLQAALGEGLRVTAKVQETAEAALREHTRRRIWLASSLIPLVIVVGILLLFIRTLPTANSVS
ncbi:MAG: cytochrome c3 family protein [Pirellulaceae bacterium]